MDGLLKKILYAYKKKLNLVFYLTILIPTLLIEHYAFADAIQREYRSANFLGKGDTGIADAKGFDAIFYNPAGIAQGKGILNEIIIVTPQAEVSTNIMELSNSLTGKSNTSVLQLLSQNQNKSYSAAIQNYTGVIFRKVAIGAFARGSANYYNYTDLSIPSGFSQVDTNMRYGAHLTIAQPLLNDRIFIGLTGKYLQKDQIKFKIDSSSPDYSGSNNILDSLINTNQRKGAGIGADVGMMFLLEKNTGTQLGIAYRNIGMTYRWVADSNKGAPTPEPTTLDVGFVSAVGTTRNKISLSLDVVDVLNTQKQIFLKRSHIGLEYSLLDMFGVQTGINQGYWVYGGYFGTKVVRIEGGVFTEEMGNKFKENPNQSAFVRVVVGWLN
jgi:hypothetical protein